METTDKLLTDLQALYAKKTELVNEISDYTRLKSDLVTFSQSSSGTVCVPITPSTRN